MDRPAYRDARTHLKTEQRKVQIEGRRKKKRKEKTMRKSLLEYAFSVALLTRSLDLPMFEKRAWNTKVIIKMKLPFCNFCGMLAC